MISVEEAKTLVVENTFPLPLVEVQVSDALNCALSEDVFSPVDYPMFDQSLMDGFAIMHFDLKTTRKLKIIGEAPAGSPFKQKLNSGGALKIFTGSKIPEGADTVVIQEKVETTNNHLLISDNNLKFGANIRRRASYIHKNDLVLKKGTVLNPGAIGYLSGLGITKVKVFRKPKVSVIITGGELQTPGNPVADGQVYESNSYSICAALQSVGITRISTSFAMDDEKIIFQTVQQAINNSDIVLISGGVSVGKYDFVNRVLDQLEVKNIFYNVAQKPGKPLYFGKKGKCLIYGLPGNPGSALSCFYEYVFPALRSMQGFTEVFLKKTILALSSEYPKKEGLAVFLKGKIYGDKVEVLPGQESGNIGSFALADCLIYLSGKKGNVLKDEEVEVHLLQ